MVVQRLSKLVAKVALIGTALFFLSTWSFVRQAYGEYIGIPSVQMNYMAAAQRNSQWCWAAAIQMVLNYYGVNILQEQIVARTYGTDPYGRLPDWAGRLDAITTNLNNWSIDNAGRTCVVLSTLNWGVPWHGERKTQVAC